MSRQFLSANTFFPAVPSAKSETPLNTAASLIPTTHWLRGYLLPLKHRYRALSAGRPQPSLFSPAPLAAGPARRWRGQRGRGVATRTWGEAPTRRRPAQRGTAAAWPAPAEPSRAGRPRPAPRAAGPRNAWPAAALRAGGAGRRAAEKLRRPRSAQRGGRAARGSRSRRASRPTPAPQGQDMGAGAAPNSEPLPRAAPAAGRRHRGARNHPPRPRGGHPAPAEKLTLRAAAGGAERARRVNGAERAAAAAARASLTRPPAARPPSRPASAARERSPGAAAAAERVRTCSVPPPSPRGTYHRGGGREGGKRRGEHGEIGGRAGCYQEDELKIGAAEKNSWSLKGQRRPRSPQAPGRGCLPGAGADLPPRRSCPRCRRRGTETGAMPARAAPGSCPCGYAGMRLLPPKRAGLHGARRGCGGGGSWERLMGRRPGSARPSPQRRVLHRSAGPLASEPDPSPQRRAGPFLPQGRAVYRSPGHLPQGRATPWSGSFRNRV